MNDPDDSVGYPNLEDHETLIGMQTKTIWSLIERVENLESGGLTPLWRKRSVKGLQVDAEALYVALDRRRRHDGITWDRIAQEVGSSASAISRLGRGVTPATDVFVRLLLWLGTTDISGFVGPSGEI